MCNADFALAMLSILRNRATSASKPQLPFEHHCPFQTSLTAEQAPLSSWKPRKASRKLRQPRSREASGSLVKAPEASGSSGASGKSGSSAKPRKLWQLPGKLREPNLRAAKKPLEAAGNQKAAGFAAGSGQIARSSDLRMWPLPVDKTAIAAILPSALIN